MSSSDAHATLRELRRTRTKHRLGDVEWFEVAYRVYLFGLVGLTAVVMASDAVKQLITDEVDTNDLLARGPAALGLVVVAACALGLRSGADGGPISIEVADIRHVLLAPIDRRSVLTQPVLQRLRSVVFAVGLVAAILGQLVARELEGSRAAWAASCALFGALVGALFVSTAVIAHVTKMPRWLASAVGAILITWQALAAWAAWSETDRPLGGTGPANLAGSIAFWGVRQRWYDLAAVLVVAIAAAVSVAVAGRLRLEPLARRGELVSQLRFAATVQDLRTIVILRRQLRAEAMRPTPWGRRSRSAARRVRPSAAASSGVAVSRAQHADDRPRPSVVWRRGLRSLRRLPAARLFRIALLAAIGGVGASLAVTSSPLFALLLLGAAFLVGMESLEPLSQEIDRPDRTEALPLDRGWLYAHHLVASAVLLACAAMIGAVAATIADPSHAAAAFGLAIPVALLGATGPVVTTVMDASAPIAIANTTITGAARGQESPFALPEFAGAATAFKTIAPVVISATAVAPVLLMRYDATAGTVVRAAVAAALFLAAVVFWIRRRDRLAIWVREFFSEGRAQL
jgi:hypothetical protein